jgi:uncharacterized protein (UPF0332 family)
MSAEKASPATGSNPLIEKAERFIRSAQLLIGEGDYDSAASRMYFAMLYIAQSLLEKRGQTFSSHRAVISAYGQQFAKTLELDPAFHKALLNAFSQRQLGDYMVSSGIPREDVESLSKDVVNFLQAAKDWHIRTDPCD